ncbi:M48 family metallopeptidase [Nitrincola schmidtii]|uniref:M48 family metallopeptidase n=1 Tax=Nitrincola schmidtii TaxID=1730894 RepID=UPI00124E6D19|nr:M48 family metallopeptidase [Nitrincola schmidtii]
MQHLRSIHDLRVLTLPLGLLLILAILTGCATSPTGRSQLTMFSESQMASMGQASFAQIKEQEKVYNHRPTQTYVQCISDALFAVAGTPSGEWEVIVFADETPNAFALPGQKIGVYRGMLNVATNPDQLAAVIGHEIGHVQARHGNERASTTFATQMGLAIASAALATEGGTDERMLAALGLGAQVGILLPFSRQHEIEADLIGLDLMARAGFDPRESIQLWENMRQKAGGSPVEFLSTHPGHGTRIRTLQESMPEAMVKFENARRQGRVPRCTPPR